MTRNNPEAKLQISVKQYLNWCLPEEIEWTANNAGVTLGATKEQRMRNGSRSKAMGVRKGWPDLQFLLPGGKVVFIELKAGASLSPEQRDFRDKAQPHGIWSLCRTVEEVETALRGWGVAMRNHPFSGEAA